MQLDDCFFTSEYSETCVRGRFAAADNWAQSVMNPFGFHAFAYVNGNPVIGVKIE